VLRQGRLGIDEILEAIVARIPPPTGHPEEPLSGLIFDAHYDSFRGTVVSCRIFEGQVKPGTSSASCTTAPCTKWRKPASSGWPGSPAKNSPPAW